MPDVQNLTQEQTLSLRLTPQQLRYVRLLEMNAAELDEAVEREIEANPALEEVEERAPATVREDSSLPVSARRASRWDEDAPTYTVPDDAPTLYDILDEQLGGMTLPSEELAAARYIVASLDPNGYLRRDPDALADDMLLNHRLDIPRETVRKALRTVRTLEPAGVGAVSLQDALLLQLQRMPRSETRDDAVRILKEDFDTFSKKHLHALAAGLGLSRERVGKAVDLIVGLNPKPGASVGGSMADAALAIVPDIVLRRDDEGGLSLSLNNRFPELTVQSSFSQAAAEMEAEAKKRVERKGEREYIMTNYNDARDFIRILGRRQKTLLDVVTAIMKIQKEYFDTEDVYSLRPMMLKDIAALTGLDLSVISRATSGKYLETPWGVFPLRFFFSDAKGEERPATSGGETDDEEVAGPEEGNEKVLTNRMIEAIIRRLVDSEDKRHPLSDEKLRLAMQDEGYALSRRAITKYRDRMEIPVARLRKEF